MKDNDRWYRKHAARLPKVPGIYIRKGDRQRTKLHVVPIRFYPLRIAWQGGYYDIKDWDNATEWKLVEASPLPEWWGDPKWMK
jgi:hypothetical protein